MNKYLARLAGSACSVSMDPERLISPELLSTHFNHLRIYIFVPVGSPCVKVPAFNFLNTPDLNAYSTI